MSQEEAVIQTFAQWNPAQILSRIRRDPTSGYGSVYDVIAIVTGCASKHIGDKWKVLGERFPELYDSVTDEVQFPGKN